jgi:3-isopropylmalate/(R)-2-methylmalate dehydratase small subunit
MDAFTVHTGRAVPLRRSNVDTDQIIPAVWLKQITRDGFEDGLFGAWRANEPGFVLNQPQYAGRDSGAGVDFGTGSSREHAVWALQNYGFKGVISPRFGDIFRGNSLKAGLLTVVLDEKVVAMSMGRHRGGPEHRGDRRPWFERQVRWSGRGARLRAG